MASPRHPADSLDPDKEKLYGPPKACAGSAFNVRRQVRVLERGQEKAAWRGEGRDEVGSK